MWLHKIKFSKIKQQKNVDIDNDKIYNYRPTLIGMLDAIYYCIPDKTICLELTRRLHGVDPHIVERISPLTWTTPLCTAVSFLDDKKVVVELMELIKSNQITQKALFHYCSDSTVALNRVSKVF